MDAGGGFIIRRAESAGHDEWRCSNEAKIGRSAPPAQLCDHGLAPPERRAALDAVAARYAVALPPALAELIDPNDPHDPIARQFVPDVAELDHRPEELDDPIGDDAHSPVEGVVHRYPDRVLLKLNAVCAVYCRFCFRRETVGPGEAQVLPAPALSAALDYIRSRSGNLGSDLDRRRSAGAVGAPLARRHAAPGRQSNTSRCCVSTPAFRWRAGAGDGGTGAGDQGQGQADLRRFAHQPSARIDAAPRVRPVRGSPTPAFRCSDNRCCWPA